MKRLKMKNSGVERPWREGAGDEHWIWLIVEWLLNNYGNYVSKQNVNIINLNKVKYNRNKIGEGQGDGKKYRGMDGLHTVQVICHKYCFSQPYFWEALGLANCGTLLPDK